MEQASAGSGGDLQYPRDEVAAAPAHSATNSGMRPLKPLTSEELLALASKGSALGPTGRSETGALVGWEGWARSHPERDSDVQVCEGREGWQAANSQDERTSEVSVVSWNILSDTWYRLSPEDYRQTAPEHGQWTNRLATLLQWVDDLGPTVIALQEVDEVKFEADLHGAMRERGYDGRLQHPKQKKDAAQPQPCGVATFWRRERFHFLSEAVKSRTLCVTLGAEQEERPLCVVNVHLEAAQSAEGADRRARQAGSALAWVEREAPGVAVVLCGDFNTGADSPLHHVLREHQWHGHALASVYEHPAARTTIPTTVATFVGSCERRYLIDHMWYTNEQLSLQRMLQPLTPIELRESFGGAPDRCLPDATIPSDHVPIAAVFRWRDPVKVPSSSPEDRKAGATHSIPLARQAEISSQWEALKSEEPAKPKGKPTPGMIEALKTHMAKKREWFAGLTEEEKQFWCVTLCGFTGTPERLLHS